MLFNHTAQPRFSPCSSTTLLNHASQPRFSTTLLNHAPQPCFSTTLLNHASQPCPSAMLFNHVPQVYKVIFFYVLFSLPSPVEAPVAKDKNGVLISMHDLLRIIIIPLQNAKNRQKPSTYMRNWCV